jgi:hypothetical protein
VRQQYHLTRVQPRRLRKSQIHHPKDWWAHSEHDKSLCAGSWADQTQENESCDHFVNYVCERVKRCAINKVTNVMDWFTTMIIIANHDDTEVCKTCCCCTKSWNWTKPRPSVKKKRRPQKHHARITNVFEWQLRVVTSPVVKIWSRCLVPPIQSRKRPPTWRPWWTTWRPRRFPITRLRKIPIKGMFRQSKSFRKQRSISMKGPKHKFLLQVRQISSRHVSGHWRKVSQLPENGTLSNKLQVTESNGVSYEHVVSADGSYDNCVRAQSWKTQLSWSLSQEHWRQKRKSEVPARHGCKHPLVPTRNLATAWHVSQQSQDGRD